LKIFIKLKEKTKAANLNQGSISNGWGKN